VTLTVITNLWPPFTARDLGLTAPFTPVVHFHKIEGLSKMRLLVDGPSKEIHTLQGVPKTFNLDGPT
jgi:hypothetical protein